ncbi:MAG: hypothetical protein ACOZAK_03275 [Patescibacteria group bacterium]
MLEREINKGINYENYLLTATTIGLLVIASFGAFSKKTKQEIWERDGGKSKLSGQRERLHAAHIDHSRDEKYDKASNGRLLTVREHYQDHYKRHGRNGLTTSGNKWALAKLWALLTGTEKRGLRPPESID